MLLPPSGLRTRTPCSTRYMMSRRAVSWEHFVILAHLDVVSLPSRPSRRWLTTRRWRSLMGRPAIRSQNRAFASTAARVDSAPSMVRPQAS